MANDIIAQAGQTVGSSAANGQIVNENGYRYEGANPNNYICLGTTTSPCPADNLYRIIGTFNEYNNSSGSFANSYVTKVIKNKTFNNGATYPFNGSGSSGYIGNQGSTQCQYNSFNNTSGTNPIYNTMNSNFYNTLSSDLKNSIATTRWYFKTNSTDYTSGYLSGNNMNTNKLYSLERSGTSIWSNGYGEFNIGLINLSDFRYSVLSSICNRTTNTNYNDNCGNKNYNWISLLLNNEIINTYTFMINPTTYYESSSGRGWHGREDIYCNSSGICYNQAWSYANVNYKIFPVFFLKNQSIFIKGDGNSSNPYYIN